jgi:predicted ATPase
LFELLLVLLERLGAERPAVLVVEDLHWADRSTRDLLAFLHRNLRHGRLLLVMTYRSDELHRRHPLRPFLAELDRAAGPSAWSWTGSAATRWRPSWPGSWGRRRRRS